MSKNKKICFVLSSELGVKAFLLEHLRSLCEIYDVTVVVNTSNPDFLKDQSIKAEVISINIHREIRIISDLITLFKLTRIFYRKHFFSVHSVSPKAGLLAMLSAFLVRTPFRIHTFTGQIWVKKNGAKKLLLKSADRLISYLSTDIIVDSPSQRQFLIEQKVVSDRKSSVFAEGSISGVDLSRFQPNTHTRKIIREKLDIPDSVTLFLFLGRLTQDKGVLDLAKAFSNMTATARFLLFVGPDEGNMTSEIQRITFNCCQYVKFIGQTDKPELFMASADVFCLPSYREGFGSVIIEAAACGIPSVASRIYGITDAIEDEVTGLMHTAGDVTDLQNKLEILYGSKTLRINLGQNARQRAVLKFDSKIITKHWCDFYKKIFDYAH